MHGLALEAMAEEPHTVMQVLDRPSPEAITGLCLQEYCASASLVSLYGKRAPHTPRVFLFLGPLLFSQPWLCVGVTRGSFKTSSTCCALNQLNESLGDQALVVLCVVVVNPHTGYFSVDF